MTWQTLGDALAELERTDPRVAEAAAQYDEAVFRLRMHAGAGVGKAYRLRTGRKRPDTVYVQLGDEPSDDDPLVAAVVFPGMAGLIVQAVNERLASHPSQETACAPDD